MARAHRGEAVDGVLLLDKPSGLTSHQALQQARRLLGAAKAGHTGTLDPLASGLLPLTLGEATKFSSDLLDADKGYRATVRFGVRTATGDAEGEVTERRPPSFDRATLVTALSQLTGSIDQVPPMHSAIKRDGRALYAYARQGIEVERAARRVTIHRLELIEFDAERATLDLECSKGTYVRVVAEDLGARLGCGAHLEALRRTRVGALQVEAGVTLEALAALPPVARRALLAPPDALLSALPRMALAEPQARRFLHGQSLDLGAAAGRVRVYGPDRGVERLLGTALVDRHGVLHPQRLVAVSSPVQALGGRTAAAEPVRCQETN